MDNYVNDEEEANAEATTTAQTEAAGGKEKETPEDRKKLVQRIASTIKKDRKHHEKAYDCMKRDMFVAMHGREESWPEGNYTANICGRHVKQKTASLYAKNPVAVAKRAERLDFAIWDEDPKSLLMAQQTVQQGMMLMAQFQMEQDAMAQAAMGAPVGPMAADPGMVMTGAEAAQGLTMPADPGMVFSGAEIAPENTIPPDMVIPGAEMTPENTMPPDPMTAAFGPPVAPPMMPPPMPEGFAEAQELIEDFTQGMERRKLYDGVGKTLEILFSNALREQKPLDFKTAAKQLVRRVCTTGVGYVELGFQREYGPRPGMQEKLADAKVRLDHLRILMKDKVSGEMEEGAAECAELAMSIEALKNEPEIIVREGLIFDFPLSTKVIPDKACKKLVGFIGARHITIEYQYTVDEIRELFDRDIGKDYAGYTVSGEKWDDEKSNIVDDDEDTPSDDKKGSSYCKVWKHYDKPSGMVYYLADGYSDFLREPATPDVFVEDFWPVYALTFNDVESESELFPPSDVALLLDMQCEHNRARQGKREHREAARPRWGYPNGSLDKKDIDRIGAVKPFDAIGLNIDVQTKLADIMQAFPVPGVDPNLYQTEEFFGDAQIVVGAQQAQLGGVSKATATESAIAEGSSASADASGTDDLDAFLTVVARSSGQILLREMSEPQVRAIVGPGAKWPHLSLTEIAEEVFLEVEAGSSGAPNRAAEMQNWQTMLPFLIQMGTIEPQWLARESLKRLDDKMDLTGALAKGIPSITAMNQNAQPMPADPAADPNAQAPEGANNGPAPPGGPAGSGPAFGSNQV